MNTNGSFRKKENPFSQVSNAALRDSQLTLKAKGLYALIQSFITIPNYTLYKTTLKKLCSEGERAFETAWKELKDRGYLIQYKSKTSGGYFFYEYELSDTAVLTESHTDEIHPLQNVPSGECTPYNNIDVNNTDVNNTDCSTSTIYETPIEKNKCSNSHLNAGFSPNGKGNGKRSFESTHELGELTDDMEISSVMQYYDAVYTNSIGRSHPRIKAEQLEQLNKKLGELMGELILEVDEVNTMIDYFFEHPPKNCDMNINVFLTNGVFVRVGYSAKVISGYTDEINY